MIRVDVERVGELVCTVAREEILPRFGRLAEGDIHAKPSPTDPTDIVTEADLAVERRLEAALAGVLPGAAFVGEEVASRRPEVLLAIRRDDPAWVLDPLDGTRDFAAGRTGFGTMLALVARGETLAAWIHLAVEDQLFVAERGSGAEVNGTRLTGGVGEPTPPHSGTIYPRFLPDAVRSEVEACASLVARRLPERGHAAGEYTALARGEKDFVIYCRLHPWDHAPGALILEEAGGTSRHFDGAPYTVRSESQPTLLVRRREAWGDIRAALAPGIRR